MKHLYLLTFLLISFLATAQPQKVTDLNEFPTESINFNNQYYFDQGTELWVSDGTAEGTEFVKDLQNEVNDITESGGKLFVIAGDDNLWISDGTEAGTVFLETFTFVSFDYESIVSYNSEYYFAANDGVNGTELWKTDGTPDGTSLVKDINPGAGSSGIRNLVVVGNHMYFAAATESGFENKIWKSDGTEAGTVVLKDFSADYNVYDVQEVVAEVNGKLFFGIHYSTDEPPYEFVDIYTSDGTEEGTNLLKNLEGSLDGYQAGINPQDFYKFQDKLYFVTNQSAWVELWVTDGTENGTALLADNIYNDGGITGFVELSDKLVFTENAQGAVTIWETDGTPDGTGRFKSLEAYRADERKMAAVDNTLFFTDHETAGSFGGSTGEDDWDLWQSELIEESTAMVKDLSGTEDTYYGTDDLVAVNNTLFFTTGDGYSPDTELQPELWTYSQPFLEPVITATKTTSLNNNKQVFPNPFNRSLNLNIQSDAEVTVFDLYGKQVYNQKHKKGSSVVNLENVGAGVYYLKIGQDESKMVKVIKR